MFASAFRFIVVCKRTKTMIFDIQIEFLSSKYTIVNEMCMCCLVCFRKYLRLCIQCGFSGGAHVRIWYNLFMQCKITVVIKGFKICFTKMGWLKA